MDDTAHGWRPELPPITDPKEALSLLRAGDSLARCWPCGWRLVRSNVQVDDGAVSILRSGGYFLDPFGGRLVPLGDQLPLGDTTNAYLSQTWIWAEDRSNARH